MWTVENFANASFRLRVINVASSTARDFFLDWVGVRVHTGTATPPGLSAVRMSPTSVTGGGSSTGTVTLTAAAPAGGAEVSLASSHASIVTLPASVTVAAGAASASFTVTTQIVSASTAVTIAASYGGETNSTSLTVNPQSAAATVAIQRAEYDDRDEELFVEASSTSATATLQVFVTSTDQLIGTLSMMAAVVTGGSSPGRRIRRASPSGTASAARRHAPSRQIRAPGLYSEANEIPRIGVRMNRHAMFGRSQYRGGQCGNL